MRPMRSWSRHSVPFRVKEPTAQFLVQMPVEAEGDGVGRVQRQSALQPFVVAQLDRKGEKGLANPSISTMPEFRLEVALPGGNSFSTSRWFDERFSCAPSLRRSLLHNPVSAWNQNYWLAYGMAKVPVDPSLLSIALKGPWPGYACRGCV